MDMKRIIVPATMGLCILALLFPPYGFRGHSFDQFAFAFSNPTLTDGSGLGAAIVWHLLAIEIGIILCGAVGLYWFLNSRARPPE